MEELQRLINTVQARAKIPGLAADPVMKPWTGEQVTHATQIRTGMSCVVAKNAAGRAMVWVESLPAKPAEAWLSAFVRFAPAGVAILGRLERREEGGWHGLAVLGTEQHGPERWQDAAVDVHHAAMVQWGVPLSRTHRVTGSAAEIEELIVDEAIRDERVEGYWLRSGGLGTWYTWQPQYAIDLVTLPRAGLATREGHEVDTSSHGYAGGYVVSTTYRGVRDGKLWGRGDIVAAPEGAEADSITVDERLKP